MHKIITHLKHLGVRIFPFNICQMTNSQDRFRKPNLRVQARHKLTYDKDFSYPIPSP
jgi:hypothetical protein